MPSQVDTEDPRGHSLEAADKLMTRANRAHGAESTYSRLQLTAPMAIVAQLGAQLLAMDMVLS